MASKEDLAGMSLSDFVYSQLFFTPPYPTTSFAGKTVIVTGSNAGLGFEAAKHFARLDAAKVIIACRSLDKGNEAKVAIEKATNCKQGVVEVWQLDLAKYDSVKAFAERANKELQRVDVLLENAGIAMNDYGKEEDNERTITVNVVSTFLLALLMLPKLKDTASKFNVRPNLTVVSSEVHFMTKLPERKAPAEKGRSIFEELNDEKTANMTDRYNVSKLLEVFVVREWAKLKPAQAYPVTINCLNPGFVRTTFRKEFKFPMTVVFFFMDWILGRTPEVGSRTLVAGATAGPDSHGAYMTDCHIADPSEFVRSDEGKKTQEAVWGELSEKLEKISPGVTKNL